MNDVILVASDDEDIEDNSTGMIKEFPRKDQNGKTKVVQDKLKVCFIRSETCNKIICLPFIL